MLTLFLSLRVYFLRQLFLARMTNDGSVFCLSLTTDMKGINPDSTSYISKLKLA